MKIALVGEGRFITTTLPHLVHEGGYDVELFGGGSDALQHALDDSCNIIIASTESARGYEDRLAGLLDRNRSFMLVDTDAGLDVKPEIGIILAPALSDEEIIARIHDTAYLYIETDDRPKRLNPRITTNITATYRCNGATYCNTLRVLSIGGCFIATLNTLPVGSELALTLAIDDAEIQLDGRIRYVIGYDLERGIITHPGAGDNKVISYPGIGVVFDEPGESAFDALTSYIERFLR